MDQELRDILDHMDLSEEDSRELLYRFLFKYSVKVQQANPGPIDPNLDILCRSLIDHDTIIEAVERQFGEFDLEEAHVKEADTVGICSITKDGDISPSVSKPGTKPFFLMEISTSYGDFGRRRFIVTDGDVWYGAIPAGETTYRLLFDADEMSQSDRKVILQAIEDYVNGQEES